ncbi:plasma membrane atpase [Trichoderma arundinaceum]|uniref:Plasma membrane atpase n=1 Tax=Trichoderma arundinaceum TaxID=490622 RepID=A0A395NJH8_TRIAR|nr:plasma membrane atpase [Trichoderma arundinaceum]
MSSAPPELPGYYYDPEKKRYFKIERSQTAPSSAQWSSTSVKRRKVESQVAEEASRREQLTKNHVKRSVLRRDVVTSGLLARETEYRRIAEPGRGRPGDEDIAAAAWARELTDKGQTAFAPSMVWDTHPHMPCFYVSGKDCGAESAIAYATLDEEMLVGTYIATDENEKRVTRPFPLLFIPLGRDTNGRPHYEMIHCPQMSSIKYHKPSHKMLLTSRQPGQGLALCVFSPPIDTDSRGQRRWILGGADGYRNLLVRPVHNRHWYVHQSTPAPASSDLLCVVGTSNGILRVRSNETLDWISATDAPPNIDFSTKVEYSGRNSRLGKRQRARYGPWTPQEIFSQDFQIDNHNVLFAGGRQPRLWITDLRAPAAGWSFVKHGSAIAHVRNINPHQVLVAGLQNHMSIYDTRFFRSSEDNPGGRLGHSSPLLDFPDYSNQAHFHIGWDVSPELNIVASAQDNGTVKLFSLSSGRALRSGEVLESFRTENPVRAMMFQTLPGEKMPNLYVAKGPLLKKFGCAPSNGSGDE